MLRNRINKVPVLKVITISEKIINLPVIISLYSINDMNFKSTGILGRM